MLVFSPRSDFTPCCRHGAIIHLKGISGSIPIVFPKLNIILLASRKR